MRSELLSVSSPGANGTVLDSDWSNSELFHQYLYTQFLKYVQGRKRAMTYSFCDMMDTGNT